MIAGFTGTRYEMSAEQKAFLESEFTRLNVTELHHGCCIGADEEANIMCRPLDIKTVGHPPIIMKAIAHCLVDYMHPPAAYMERNHAIVDACEILFVAPRTNNEELRSGTWATFRYADRIGQRIIMIER